MTDTSAQNEILTPEQKKSLAKKRAFYAILIIDAILAIVLAWAVISIFVN